VNLVLRHVYEPGILKVIFWCKSDSAGEGLRKLHHNLYQIILGGDEKFIQSLLRIENCGHQEAYNEIIWKWVLKKQRETWNGIALPSSKVPVPGRWEYDTENSK